MNKYFFLLAITTTLNLFSQNKNRLLIKNVNLINVEKGVITKNINIYIKDGIIAQIESDVKKIKTEAKNLTIDGTGKFLMSGYFDSYSIMPSKSNPINYDTYFLFNLINGITTQVVMKYDEINEAYRDSINVNKMLGTNLFLCQPAIKSFNGYQSMEKSFTDNLSKGLNQIKYVEGLSPNQLDSVSSILKKYKINFNGRVHELGLGENIKAGMKNIYHVKELDLALEKDSHNVYKLLPEMGKKNMFITPTLFFHNYEWDQFSKEELYAFPELNLIPKYLKSFWVNQYDDYDKTYIQAKNLQYTTERKDFRRRLDNYNLMLKKMEICKVRFLVGSDETPFNVPGYAFHREIQLLSNAKLTNQSIIKAITVNASDAIGMSSKIGDVKIGMMADIVILNNNPLENIKNLKDINAVVKFGNYYNINELQELLNKSITNDRK
jgi:imidazolonepropionase-like amidohydrolase